MFILGITRYSTRWSLLRSIFRSLQTEKFVRRLGVRNRISDFNELLLLWNTVFNSRYETVAERLFELHLRRVPTLFIYGEKDKLFKKEIFEEELRVMGANEDFFTIIDEDFEMMQEGKFQDDWLKVLLLRGGGHYAFSNDSYFSLVHDFLDELLEKSKWRDEYRTVN